MKILTIGDVESKYLWDYFEKSKLEGVDLIISCGDLAAEYLSFLATFTSAPVLYVHGNHDERYAKRFPISEGINGYLKRKNGTVKNLMVFTVFSVSFADIFFLLCRLI